MAGGVGIIDAAVAIFEGNLRGMWSYRSAVRRQPPALRRQIDQLWAIAEPLGIPRSRYRSHLRDAISSVLNSMDLEQASAWLELGVRLPYSPSTLEAAADTARSLPPEFLATCIALANKLADLGIDPSSALKAAADAARSLPPEFLADALALAATLGNSHISPAGMLYGLTEIRDLPADQLRLSITLVIKLADRKIDPRHALYSLHQISGLTPEHFAACVALGVRLADLKADPSYALEGAAAAARSLPPELFDHALAHAATLVDCCISPASMLHALTEIHNLPADQLRLSITLASKLADREIDPRGALNCLRHLSLHNSCC
jgi:hypothetical protein